MKAAHRRIECFCLAWLVDIFSSFLTSLYFKKTYFLWFLYITVLLWGNVCLQIGKTKIFLRAGQMAELDARRAEVLGNAARTIQWQIRTYIARKEFISLRGAAINLQSYLRGVFLNSVKVYLSFCLLHHYLNLFLLEMVMSP